MNVALEAGRSINRFAFIRRLAIGDIRPAVIWLVRGVRLRLNRVLNLGQSFVNEMKKMKVIAKKFTLTNITSEASIVGAYQFI